MASRSPILFTALVIAAVVSMAQAQAPDQDTYLTLHNDARSAVGVAPLTWSTPAYLYALSWAQQQAAQACPFQHSQGGPYGENIYWAYNSAAPPTATEAVTAWVSEKQYYDYTTNSCAAGKVCGHYTQVVWAATTSVGCASANCSNGPNRIFFVCSYDPPGNVVGQKPY